MKGIVLKSLLVILLIAVAVGFVLLRNPEPAYANLTDLQTFTLPSNPLVTHTSNTYIVLWDTSSGDLVNITSGTVYDSNTWNVAYGETTVHSNNGLVHTVLIPPLNRSLVYGMAVFDSATPLKTDVPTDGPYLYNPEINMAYESTNPSRNAKVRTTGS
jgi:hypothetical protein